MLFYVLYVIFCWVMFICYSSIVPSLTLTLLFPLIAVPIDTPYGMLSTFFYRLHILHSTQDTHLLTLLLTPRHCPYPLRHTPKHTAISFSHKIPYPTFLYKSKYYLYQSSIEYLLGLNISYLYTTLDIFTYLLLLKYVCMHGLRKQQG